MMLSNPDYVIIPRSTSLSKQSKWCCWYSRSWPFLQLQVVSGGCPSATFSGRGGGGGGGAEFERNAFRMCLRSDFTSQLKLKLTSLWLFLS